MYVATDLKIVLDVARNSNIVEYVLSTLLFYQIETYKKGPF